MSLQKYVWLAIKSPPRPSVFVMAVALPFVLPAVYRAEGLPVTLQSTFLMGVAAILLQWVIAGALYAYWEDTDKDP